MEEPAPGTGTILCMDFTATLQTALQIREVFNLFVTGKSRRE